jgi:hypothetical protein
MDVKRWQLVLSTAVVALICFFYMVSSYSFLGWNENKPSFTQYDCPVKARGALDLGSGMVKADLALAYVCPQGIHVIQDSVLYKEVPKRTGESFDFKTGVLKEEEIIGPSLEPSKEGSLLQALLYLKNSMEEEFIQKYPSLHLSNKDIHWKGIATAVFRKAHNGEKLLTKINEKTHFNIKLINQNEEADLSFYSVASFLGPTLLEDRPLVVWDIGGGSTQITFSKDDLKPSQRFNTSFGSTTFKHLVTQVLKKPDLKSINPILRFQDNFSQHFQKIQKAFVEELKIDNVQLSQMKTFVNNASHPPLIIGIGGLMNNTIRKKACVENKDRDEAFCKKEDIESFAKSIVHMNDQEIAQIFPKDLAYVGIKASDVLLILCNMEALGIQSFYIKEISLGFGLLAQK